LFFKRKEFDYPLGGGFGEGFDGCGTGCGVVIAAEPTGVVTAGAGICCGDICARLSNRLKYSHSAVCDGSDRDKYICINR
jgi:hypothetical protein